MLNPCQNESKLCPRDKMEQKPSQTLTNWIKTETNVDQNWVKGESKLSRSDMIKMTKNV